MSMRDQDNKNPPNKECYDALSALLKLPADEIKEALFSMGALGFPCELSMAEAAAVTKAFRWLVANNRKEFCKE